MLTKFASVEQILEVKTLSERIGFAYGEEAGDRLVRFAAAKDHREEDGFLYVRCRAISSRVNKNNDGWPSEELARSYKSFIGKPIFVDHNNDDPKRTRGVIVDAQLHVEDPDKTAALDPYYATAPNNHKPPTWIELLMEVDAKTFPKLAKAIKNGDMDAVSMGANIEKSVCSVCANEAATPSEYCNHVKQKGLTFEITSDNGEKIRKKAYEDCYGIGFFEISNVFDPADPTADSWLDDAQRAAKLAARAEAEGLNKEEVLAYVGLKNEGVLAKAASTGKPLTNEVMERLALSLPQDPNEQDQAVSIMRQIIEAYQVGDVNEENRLKAQLATMLGGEQQAAMAYAKFKEGASWSDGRTDRNPQMGGPRNLGDLPAPDLSPGDVIAAYEDGTIILDDGITTYNPERALQFFRDTGRFTGPDVARDPNRQGSIPKGAPYPENSYKNAPDHSPKNQKKWPKEVNAIYNACMREGNGKGDTKEEKESSCAAIAWSTYKKDKKSSTDKESGIVFSAHPAMQFVKPVGLGGESPEHERNYEPQSEMTTAPQDVDTLRSESRCPVCQAADMETDPDGIMRCPTCGHVQEPEPLDNPDLGVARDIELRQDVTDNSTPEGEHAVPAHDPLDGVQFAPQEQGQLAATKNSTSDEGISEMFTLKLRTSKKEEADALVPVEQKVARVELKLGANGIHRGVYDAAREAGLAVKVTYPAVKDEENFVEVPGDNGVFNLFFAQESASELKIPVSEVPIIIEADSAEDLDKFKNILATTERPGAKAAKAAAADNKQKDTILPSDAKPSDEPKDASVISDELEPRETKTVTVSDDMVELDGKKYHLTEINDDDAPKADASDEKAEDDKSTVEDADKDAVDDEPVETDAAKALADEVADEDDKESKLLAAFKIADLAVELGLVTAENKMAFIAELEDESNESLSAREATMKAVKTAGLAKKTARRVDGVRRIPRLSHAVVASTNGGTPDTTPDEALFL
jgi:hypothetical protein